jgi:sugar phosphate isomerase/epimerase
MKIALCNEVLAPLEFADQCALAARLGYDGLEIAPFTLAQAPERISAREARGWRATAESSGLVVTGLHWLLVRPPGLSVTAPDERVRQRTLEVATRLVALCAELGGRVLVHGSPQQRAVAPGETLEVARARLVEFLARIAEVAAGHGLTYCIEPLAARETALVNNLEEAAKIVREVGSPALRTMIDCSAAAAGEALGVPELIDRWLPTGLVAHVQANDPNRRAPGQGELRFGPILDALERHGYAGTLAVEPFDYVPDGPGCAAWSLAYLRGVRDGLGLRR